MLRCMLRNEDFEVMSRRKEIVLAGFVALWLATPAHAEPPGLYVTGDGSWQNVRLPSFGLGFRKTTDSPDTFDRGPFDDLSSNVTGAGRRGAVGYNFGPGTFNPLLGIGSRVEIGGSYVDADGASSAASTLTDGRMSPVLLSGAGIPFTDSFWCSSGFRCPTASALTTDYRNWQMYGKFATDYTNGTSTLTPYLSLFGGNGRNNQAFGQSFSQVNSIGDVVNTGSYNASTQLDWDDFGGKVGVDSKIPVNSWLAVQLGGAIGFAHRNASLAGQDRSLVTGNFAFSGTSTVNDNESTTALIANAEAALIITPISGVSLRGFAGIIADSDVPGVAGPSFTGRAVDGPATVTPAGIDFDSETSYYAGGGLVASF